MNGQAHWECIYAGRPATEVSWYEVDPSVSLQLIERANVDRSMPVIDIGGGASVLVDALHREGYGDITVLDLSRTALDVARKRLGNSASAVRWLEGDVLCVELPPAHYALWHDRAVFHFLTSPADRQQYVNRVVEATLADSHVVIATFALDGPPRCSGLDVARYSAADLQTTLGEQFTLVHYQRHEHRTPSGGVQPFTYCLFRRKRHGA